ncbi:MAG: mitochondrial splicing system protein [Chaenotheca gracillima]|nr:MAG: mitochondrial splicing system protein [Chaenotheca gracillima]
MRASFPRLLRRDVIYSRHVPNIVDSGGCISRHAIGGRAWSFTSSRWQSHLRGGNSLLQASGIRDNAIETSAQSTIYALSTAPGKAAIAVIRISGPACATIYSSLCPNRPFPKPRTATLRKLYEPHQPATESTILDAGALILFFPGPQTVTGEDVLELHTHGGPAVVKAVLGSIPRCVTSPSSSTRHRIRYAEAGEFTRRAFMNDRLDLTQIEALGDTLSATTEQQRRLSVRNSATTTNGLSTRYETWRQHLLHARGELEALIDFSEDQHFDESPRSLTDSVATQIRHLRSQIGAHAQNAIRGELLRNGISISLLGAPNAGKSSLLNRVVGRDAAIVSTEEGTTRDIVEVGIDLGGWFVRLGDMAGLRVFGGEQTSDVNVGVVEREGINRAIDRALASDVLVVVVSIEPSTDTGTAELRLDHSVVETARRYCERTEKGTVIVAVNKIDHIPSGSLPRRYVDALTSAIPGLDTAHIFGISCMQANAPPKLGLDHDPDPGNIQNFLQGLISAFKAMTTPVLPSAEGAGDVLDQSIYETSLGASERQRLLLEECSAHLDGFLSGLERSGDDDIDIVVLAEELRAAAGCLARMTGRGEEAGDVEEVLGVVFEKFCVGK